MSPTGSDVAAGHRLAGAIWEGPGGRCCHARGRQRGVDAAGALTLPPGQLGHGMMAMLRRQPCSGTVPPPGTGTGLFELICGDCGDHPYLNYSEVSARLQRLRGPRMMRAALAAYETHLGLITRPGR